MLLSCVGMLENCESWMMTATKRKRSEGMFRTVPPLSLESELLIDLWMHDQDRTVITVEPSMGGAYKFYKHVFQKMSVGTEIEVLFVLYCSTVLFAILSSELVWPLRSGIDGVGSFNTNIS